MVEPHVRVNSHLPPVHTFILASTNELTNSPAQNAITLAATIRQVLPNTDSYVAWQIAPAPSLASTPANRGSSLAAQPHCANGGMATTTKLMNAMNSIAKKPTHTQRRALAYP